MLAILVSLGLTAMSSAPTHGASLINDTGVAFCVDANRQFTTVCTGTGQDAAFGRDVTNPDARDGLLGFSFSKVCNNGSLAGSPTCPLDPALGPASKQWGCTLDNVTGLMWEVKLTDGSIRDQSARYTNLRPDQPGYAGATDAQGYINKINARSMCGFADWRLPSYQQLLTLVDYGLAHPQVVFDPVFFPNTVAGPFWSADAYVARADDAWYVLSQLGQSFPDGRVSFFFVRLVRVSP